MSANQSSQPHIHRYVRRGYDAVCIERIDGTRVTLLSSAWAGRCRCTPGARRGRSWRSSPKPSEQLTDATPITPEALLEELRATRERGYAVSDQDVTPGIADFGAPIFDHTGRVRASLSVGGMRAHLYEHHERAIELLTGVAAEISRTPGHEAARAA